jgi:hypothetical protein
VGFRSFNLDSLSEQVSDDQPDPLRNWTPTDLASRREAAPARDDPDTDRWSDDGGNIASEARLSLPPQPASGGSNHHQTGDHMARIIVTTDATTNPTTNHSAPALLDEIVYSVHLANDHNAAELIQRLGWAISDADNTQRTEQAL